MSKFLNDKVVYILASCALRNSAPSSASVADAATSLRMVQVILIAPLMMIGLASHGKLPRKKYPPAMVQVILIAPLMMIGLASHGMLTRKKYPPA